MSEFVRVEYYGPEGWVTGHKGIDLADPQRYVDRLLARSKYARCLEVGEDLEHPPGARVWEPKDLPDVSTMRWPTDGTAVPVSEPPPPPTTYPPCDLCGAADHLVDAECLLT